MRWAQQPWDAPRARIPQGDDRFALQACRSRPAASTNVVRAWRHVDGVQAAIDTHEPDVVEVVAARPSAMVDAEPTPDEMVVSRPKSKAKGMPCTTAPTIIGKMTAAEVKAASKARSLAVASKAAPKSTSRAATGGILITTN